VAPETRGRGRRPARSASEGFGRCVDDSIEIVDVHNLASVDDETSAISITIVSLRGERFRVRVTSARSGAEGQRAVPH
jgi:hypothetical protein